MDKALRKNILLGLFVTVGIVLFIIGIFQVGAKNEMFKKTFSITARFNNANGLKMSSSVRFNGVKVGIVQAVSLINDTLVQVDMQIEDSKRHFITDKAVASIVSDGLMGDKMVNITSQAGGGAEVKNNSIIESHNALNTDDVLRTLNASNENVRVITDNLRTFTGELNSENGALQMLYKDPAIAAGLKQSMNNLNVVTKNVLVVSANLRQITYKVQHGKGALSEALNDTALGDNLAATLTALQQTSQRLNSVSGRLNDVIQQVNSGKGTIGMVLSDTAFSNNVQQSLINIKNATKELDEDAEGLKHSFLLRKYFRKKEKNK